MLVVRKDDPANGLEDLEGARYGYINKSCSSSYFAAAILLGKRGKKYDDFLDFTPVKAWQGQIDAVVAKEVRATMVPEDVWKTDPKNAQETKIIGRYDNATPALVVVRENLDEAICKTLLNALVAWTPKWEAVYGAFRPFKLNKYMALMIAEALVPAFFVMFLGYFAGARRIIDNQHVASLNAVLMTFSLPVALFVGVAQASLSGLEENGKLVFVLIVSMLMIFGITFAVNHYVFRLSPGENAVQSLSVGFPNFSAVGFPLLGRVMGPGSTASVAASIAAGTVFISPLTLTVLEARGKAAGSSAHPIATALVRSVCKPVVIAPVAGLVLALLRIHLDEVVSHSLNLIGAAAAGLACFVTGLVLSAQPLRLNANVGVGVLIKNIVLPLVAYAIVLALGMSGEIADTKPALRYLARATVLSPAGAPQILSNS